MATIIRDPVLEKRILAERAASGLDRYDEVWEGVYIKAPMPDDEHQMLVGRLTRVFDEVVGDPSLGSVRPGVNVSCRVEGWLQDYRVPDVAVFLNNTHAVNHGAFWHGGPDFAVEIVSPGDHARDKIGFYAAAGCRELLVVDRAPWQLELYRLMDSVLQLAGTSSPNIPSTPDTPNTETGGAFSEVLNLEFRLRHVPGDRPQLCITEEASRREWII